MHVGVDLRGSATNSDVESFFADAEFASQVELGGKGGVEGGEDRRVILELGVQGG